MNHQGASTAVLVPPAGMPPLPHSPELPPPAPVPPLSKEPTTSTTAAPSEADNAWTLGDTLRQLPSWLVSMVFHLTLVIGLALGVTNVTKFGDGGNEVSYGTQSEATMALEGSEEPAAETIDLQTTADSAIEPLPASELLRPEAVDEPFVDSPLAPTAATPIDAHFGTGDATPDANVGNFAEGEGLGALTIGKDPGDMLKGRLNGANRAALVKRDGGSPESEAAVGRALKWLAIHQLADGSWNFNHQKSPKCGKKCSEPGNLESARFAATALALLPFLGQGHTHKQGEYKAVVDRGLYFLTRSMRYSGSNGSLHDPAGRMYGHGLASIVLCEAYGLTHDPTLKGPAQAALNYIVMAQDPRGGGWRYNPQQSGDTSVVGWQLMALKSGHMAYLKVPEQTITGVNTFLDEVQDNYGATYGYTGPGAGAATSAIGLLCRLYLDWKPSHDAIQRGVQVLERTGPSLNNGEHGAGKNNMYYNYYATQVLHHVGGYPWEQWNAIMRDYLVKTQSTEGHETGSWYFEGNDMGSPQGGRLYCTAMSAMILEVYYRHLPLYRQQSVLDKFGQ